MREFVATRQHIFDGFFYPKCSGEIIFTIDNLFHQIEASSKDREVLFIVKEFIKNKKILTFIVPHGAYRYSGYVSSLVYYLIGLIECNKFIILSPDHNGTSPGISIMDRGYWSTPMGCIQISEELGLKLLDKDSDNFIHIDPFSLSIDHAIETQLPFLQYVKRDGLEFIPILQRTQGKYASIKLADILSSIVPKDEHVTLIVTSNFSHYLCYDECYRKDKKLLSDILSMNIETFYKTLEDNSMTLCGYGCIASAIEFSKRMKNNDAILLKYLTSGDIDGNKSSVVGYSSLILL
ncbi:MAG: AmmeMemoRadiSam system protein B [Thermoproteota archaeon]|nr:AmmeMemoRadiSam system protein B [Thermoproteota archaeon]